MFLGAKIKDKKIRGSGFQEAHRDKQSRTTVIECNKWPLRDKPWEQLRMTFSAQALGKGYGGRARVGRSGVCISWSRREENQGDFLENGDI